jgi:hypothetical protein
VSCINQLKRSMPSVLVPDDDLQWGGVDGILMWLREVVLPLRSNETWLLFSTMAYLLHLGLR